MVRARPLVAAFAGAGVAIACSESDPAPAGSNGVNDVKKACAIRVAWGHGATSSHCIECIAAAGSPPCSCPDRPASAGRCASQQAQRAQLDSSCDGVEACRFRCHSSDCACLDACYAGKDACRAAASALDGCVAEACASDCVRH